MEEHHRCTRNTRRSTPSRKSLSHSSSDGIKNIFLWDMNVQRIAVENLPAAVPPDRLLNSVHAFLVLFDWHANYGATLLIAFVILASTLHHRFGKWDPMIRNYHFLLITNNGAIAGLLPI